MAIAIRAERLCESQSRILPWWTPQSISVAYSKNGQPAWKTPPRISNLASYSTYAISPFDREGRCNFIVFDVDSNKEEDVDRLLQALPKGAVPLVSVSGKKGWHVWIFPAEPIPGEVACGFARAVAKRAGVSCETFPSSPEKSRCLKWPGCPHPETGQTEVFIEWRGDKHELDTRVMLEAIEGGMFRTPVKVISGMRLTPQASPDGTGCTPGPPKTPYIFVGLIGGIRENPSVHTLSSVPKLCLADWFRDESVVLALVHRLGARVRRVGAPFRCVLPHHRERKPSAALYQCDDGTIVYHDFHAIKYVTEENPKVLEFLTPSEVFAASVSGVVRELPSKYQQAVWGVRFLMEAGFIAAPEVNAPLLPATFPREARQIYDGFVLLTQVRQLAGLTGPAQFSERFASSWCRVSPRLACKATNLLAVVGALRKHEADTSTFSLGTATREEMEATYDVLGRPSVSRFNKKLVEEKMGIETAQAIFRR